MEEEQQETTSQQEQATVARPTPIISKEKLEEIKMHYIYKPIYHILGDLCHSKVYADSTTQLAKEIRCSFNDNNRNNQLPSLESLACYIRQGLDNNEELHTWIENYVKRN